MHKYHNRSRFTLVYECVMCTRVLFSLYIFVVSSSSFVVILAIRERRSTRRRVSLCYASRLQSSALERDSAALTIREIQSPHSGISSSPKDATHFLQKLNFIFFLFSVTFLHDAETSNVRN